MKYRPQRGGLKESMDEVVELEDSLSALAGYLGVSPETVHVTPYRYDDRIGWNTYLVTVDGQGVGFTDGPVTRPTGFLARRTLSY